VAWSSVVRLSYDIVPRVKSINNGRSDQIRHCTNNIKRISPNSILREIYCTTNVPTNMEQSEITEIRRNCRRDSAPPQLLREFYTNFVLDLASSSETLFVPDSTCEVREELSTMILTANNTRRRPPHRTNRKI
jgi:hypothetical protein